MAIKSFEILEEIKKNTPRHPYVKIVVVSSGLMHGRKEILPILYNPPAQQ